MTERNAKSLKTEQITTCQSHCQGKKKHKENKRKWFSCPAFEQNG